MACTCPTCREEVKPGVQFKRLVNRAWQYLEPKHRRYPKRREKKRRFTTIEVMDWMIKRRKKPLSPGWRMRRVKMHALRLLQERMDTKRIDIYKVFEALSEWTGIKLCESCHADAGSCSCWFCGWCEEWYKEDDDPQCSNCEHCSNCCDCAHCENCGGSVNGDDLCPECACCPSCCGSSRRGCGDRSRPPRVRPAELTFHGEPSDLYPRYIGVEIECGLKGRDHRPLKACIEKWGATAQGDGSIDLQGAVEIATAPARGKAFEEQVTDITSHLHKSKAWVDMSCGLHVHVGVKDLTSKEILSLVTAYTAVEPALYQIVAPSRRNGSYSRAWGTSFERAQVLDRSLGRVRRIKNLEAMLYGDEATAAAVKARPYKHSCRYYGLNLNALLLYGTVEFRLHQGTVNARKILMWSALCCGLVEFSSKVPERTIAEMVGTPMEKLLGMMPSADVREWIADRREHFSTSPEVRMSAGRKVGKNVEPVELSERE